MSENELIDRHFDLGMGIRNTWQRQEGSFLLKMDCGKLHPDDASGVITRALWERLRT